jgi:4-alpha-glucanotransferase
MNTATSMDRMLERSAGLLLHVTSLPGPHGIGDLGPAAYDWVDRLARAGQTWWQILPLGPTGYADSPYQCFSAFAGNPNLISLERLVDQRLLKPPELPSGPFSKTETDYDAVRPLKEQATATAFERFRAGESPRLQESFKRFCQQESAWLDSFALFVALKQQNGGVAWYDWPIEQRKSESPNIARIGRELSPAVELCKFRQFLFFDQWRELRRHAEERGVRLIGDMPIFIASDSADVWAHPELFELDANRRPTFVAGVPPDYFSKTGQLWGNPIYDWQQHRATGYQWWISRLQSTLKLVDLVRLDHFRGFEAYWAVPADAPTAEPGSWQPGPKGELFTALREALGSLPLIAEDLGVITPEVDALRRAFGLPGMRVLQFAFGGAIEARFIPHRYVHHTVAYTGTHDNETTVGWFKGLDPAQIELLARYAPGAVNDPAWGLIRLAWASVADLAIAPLQDVLRLGNEARMNLPGRTEGNWRWRVDPALLKPELFEQLSDLTTIYERARMTPVEAK